jgi:hypothetical protein
MNLSVTDPAILFPGISLLFLAYTNRYLTLAQVVRSLTSAKNTGDLSNRRAQIANLYLRISLIKYMQACGIVAFLLCLGSMISLLYVEQSVGEYLFIGSLVVMSLSLVVALVETLRSGVSLRLELKRFETDL